MSAKLVISLHCTRSVWLQFVPYVHSISMGPVRTILRTSVSSAVSQECSQVACEMAHFNFENPLLCLRDRGFSLQFVRADSAESICTSFGTPSITQSLEGNSPSFLIEMSSLHLIHSFPICAARCCEALWYL